MRQIKANLPALGAFRVNLHHESEKLLDFFGEEELDRLGRINHLGASAVAFSGINHTRLEYVLIQCAIAQLVSKLYKDNADLALANSVELDGTTNNISSGEELLKCWAILGNVCHPNWTFTSIRVLFDSALQNTDFRNWLVSGATEPDIKAWANWKITNYDDRSGKHLITLLRLKEENPNDPRKHLFRQIVRNQVLSSENLKFKKSSAKEKLLRLRSLYQNIQLLSMVALDAYYSHSPVRLELLPAIQELAESATHLQRLQRFLGVLQSTAGWLADEVYLHPLAISAQRAYEIRAGRRSLKRFKEQGTNSKKRKQFLKSVMADGFGQPKAHELEPLIRLTFPLFSTRLLSRSSRYVRVQKLNSEIGVNPNSLVCVDDNKFSSKTYLDVLYRPNGFNAREFGQTYQKLLKWLLKSIETDALEAVRRVLPQNRRSEETIEDTRVRVLLNRLKSSENHLETIILSIVNNIIPSGWTAGIENPSFSISSPSIAWQVKDSKNVTFNELETRINSVLVNVKSQADNARKHELSVLKGLALNISSEMLAVLVQPLVIRDALGRKKDEWDGTILEMNDKKLNLSVIEAKGGSKKGQRANIAFQQLAETRKIIRSQYSFKTTRKRILGMGAYLDVELWG